MTKQQFEQAKAKLYNKKFQDEYYTDDMYIADLKGLKASWLIARYIKRNG